MTQSSTTLSPMQSASVRAASLRLLPRWLRDHWLYKTDKLVSVSKDGVITSPVATFELVSLEPKIEVQLLSTSYATPWSQEDIDYLKELDKLIKGAIGTSFPKRKVFFRELTTDLARVTVQWEGHSLDLGLKPSDYPSIRDWGTALLEEFENRLAIEHQDQIESEWTNLRLAIGEDPLRLIVMKAVTELGDTAKTRLGHFIQGKQVMGYNDIFSLGDQFAALSSEVIDQTVDDLVKLGYLAARTVRGTSASYEVYGLPYSLPKVVRTALTKKVATLTIPVTYSDKTSCEEISHDLLAGDVIPFLASYQTLVLRARHGLTKADIKLLDLAKRKVSSRKLKNLIRDLIDYGTYPDLAVEA